MKMTTPKREKKPHKDLEAALKEAERQGKKQKAYKYTLEINQDLMSEFMGLCKRERSSAPQELTKFIERYVKARESRLPPGS